ncbi:hypothetical protein VTN00DRAFT_4217 [Thermoascus crustaceus]|uniref:uncharacterized protein n=1 Tax=Thermoascus crustaceus TaxID=5088 RepID=UPI003742174F
MDCLDLPIYWLSDVFPPITMVASIYTENDEREGCRTCQLTLNNLLNTRMVSDLELTGVERVRWRGIESTAGESEDHPASSHCHARWAATYEAMNCEENVVFTLSILLLPVCSGGLGLGLGHTTTTSGF